jgi:hypothetical protein
MGIISSILVLVLAQSTSIPAGTALEATLESEVGTASSGAGDAVTAVVTSPVRDTNKVVIPKGARLNGRIETIQPASQDNVGRVRLVFREIQLPDGRRIQTWITNSFDASPPNRNLRYPLLIGAGAAAGGLIGGTAARVAGIIGGTLVGFIIAGNSGNSPRDLTLKPGQRLHLQLGEDLKLP